jgi:hypothetical protein
MPLCSALVLCGASARLASSHRRTGDAELGTPLRTALLCFSAPRLLASPRLIDEPMMPSATSPVRSALLPTAASARLTSSHRRAADAERDIPALLCFPAPRLLVLPRLIDEPLMPNATSPLRSALLPSAASARLASSHRRTGDAELGTPLRTALLCFSAPRLLASPRLIVEPLMPNATSPLCSALLLSATSACLALPHRRAGNSRPALLPSAASARLASPHRRAGDTERDIPAPLCFSAPRLLVLRCLIDEPVMPAPLCSASQPCVCSSCLFSLTSR